MGKDRHDTERSGNNPSERKELSATQTAGKVGLTFAIPEKRNRLLCRLEDAAAVGNNLIETGVVAGLTIREVPPTESGVWDFSQYRDAAGNALACYALEWEQVPDHSVMGVPNEPEALAAPIKFSIYAALAFEQWTQSRDARWQKIYIGPGSGDIRRM